MSVHDTAQKLIAMAQRMTWRQRRHCPHSSLRGIYGDEINRSGFRRLQCRDCGRYLDGPVHLARLREDEPAHSRGRGRE